MLKSDLIFCLAKKRSLFKGSSITAFLALPTTKLQGNRKKVIQVLSFLLECQPWCSCPNNSFFLCSWLPQLLRQQQQQLLLPPGPCWDPSSPSSNPTRDSCRKWIPMSGKSWASVLTTIRCKSWSHEVMKSYPDRRFRRVHKFYEVQNIVHWLILRSGWYENIWSSTRRTLSQICSFKIRRKTFLSFIKFTYYLLILRLYNCERARRVNGSEKLSIDKFYVE